MISKITYKPKEFDLSGLNGISDETLEMHFKLYQGYVKETNKLTEKISEFLKDGKVDQEEMPAYSELTRRLGFEYNGMVLHEYYFGNMRRQGSVDPGSDSTFRKLAEDSFGSYDLWKADFVSVGKMRGVGWAMCYQNPANGAISNHWITLHETGNVSGFVPVLVMDVWEHAFLLDYAPAERPKYIEAFFSNIDWAACEERLKLDAVSRPAICYTPRVRYHLKPSEAAMKSSSRLFALALACALTAAAGCATADNANSNTTATTTVTPPAPSPAPQALSQVERPQKIKDQTAQRGEQDSASPALRFVEPRDGATITGSTVNVRLALSGDLKGYKPGKDPATGLGNHIHIILDNEPYEAYYNLDQPFELRNVTAGKHTLRVFASRPWHESYKNAGSFQMVSFTVSGGGDASKPTTTGTGQTMADNRNASNANAAAANANAAASPAPAREGKDLPGQPGAVVDAAKPILTYSRPKGEYKGPDADAIMIDFWLANAKLQGDGGEYRVRYSVDGGEQKFIDKWEPIWLAGWAAGAHKVRLELVDKGGNVVDNGGFNATERTITVVR